MRGRAGIPLAVNCSAVERLLDTRYMLCCGLHGQVQTDVQAVRSGRSACKSGILLCNDVWASGRLSIGRVGKKKVFGWRVKIPVSLVQKEKVV